MGTTIKVYIPTGEPNASKSKLAERPKSLAGLRVAILDNGKEFSDIVLEALAEVLNRDFGVSETRFWRKGYPAKAAPFISEMAAVSDVAISGVGHCGSSSPWSVHDSVALEKAGIPTVTLISRSFCPLGQVVARGLGYPGLPIILLPHPIGDPDLQRIRSKGIDAAKECVRLLTGEAAVVNQEFIANRFSLPEHVVARA
jgi:hypothetical protein